MRGLTPAFRPRHPAATSTAPPAIGRELRPSHPFRLSPWLVEGRSNVQHAKQHPPFGCRCAYPFKQIRKKESSYSHRNPSGSSS